MRARNLEFERDITRWVVKGMDVDPEPFIAYCETRASSLSSEYVSDPMLVATDLDRDREAREELADARNHLVWKVEENPDDPSNRRRLAALRKITSAYADLLDD